MHTVPQDILYLLMNVEWTDLRVQVLNALAKEEGKILISKIDTDVNDMQMRNILNYLSSIGLARSYITDHPRTVGITKKGRNLLKFLEEEYEILWKINWVSQRVKFIKCLEEGPKTVKEIHLATGIPNTTLYDTKDYFLEKHLIKELSKEKYCLALTSKGKEISKLLKR